MKRIRVTGTIEMRGHYMVELDMSESEFGALSEQNQKDAISEEIDWREWINLANINDVVVDYLEGI